MSTPVGFEHLTVLHIEDDDVDHVYVARCLERSPGAVRLHHAQDMPEASALLAQQHVDVVLLDLHVGTHQGLASLSALRAIAPDLPVVVLTGSSDGNLGVGAISAGADDYLMKDRIEPLALWNALVYSVARSTNRGSTPPTVSTSRRSATRPGPPAALLAPGTEVGRYLVECEIGRGGMAVVYRARHRTLDTMHALKVMNVTPDQEPARMLQEARLQARLRHANVVGAFDMLELGPDAIAIVMEYVAGPNLQQWLAGRTVPGPEWFGVVRGITAGLAHAHAEGLVHRDLKPTNVLLADAGREVMPRISDFGIAKWLQSGDAVEGLTQHNASMGTPGYMAPEQIDDAGSVDHRADLFSLGCILHLLASGQPAIPGSSPMARVLATARGEVSALPAHTPPALARIVEGLVRVDPADRTPDCETVLDQLSAVHPDSLPACTLGTRTRSGPTTRAARAPRHPGPVPA